MTVSIATNFSRRSRDSAGGQVKIDEYVSSSLERKHTKPSTLCKFFKVGKCNAGDSCQFLHSGPAIKNAESTVCKFFIKGTCKFGSNCALAHPADWSADNDVVPFAPLPSPLSIKDPSMPLPIRQKSMPDIFRWSADDESAEPSRNFLFFSSSVNSGDDSKYMQPQTGRSSSLRINSAIQSDNLTPLVRRRGFSLSSMSEGVSYRSVPERSLLKSPDPFSPFPEDYEIFCVDFDGDTHSHDVSDSSAVVCTMCYNQVVSCGNGRFGILFCDHPFCLSCIRTWRANRVGQGMPVDEVLACPVCSVLSPFITPSETWLNDKVSKSRALEAFRRKISRIPCKYFYAQSQCPMENQCFYVSLHILSQLTSVSHTPRPTGTGNNSRTAVDWHEYRKTCCNPSELTRQEVCG